MAINLSLPEKSGRSRNKTAQEKIEVIRAFQSSPLTIKEFTKQHNICDKSLKRWQNEYSHLADLQDGHLPQGHHVRGTSVLYDDEGRIKQQWIKTDKAKDDFVSGVKAMLDEAKEDLPQLPPIQKPENYNDGLASVIPIGDAHIGMFSTKDETGADFNLDIAKQELCAAVKYVIDFGLKCDKCFIFNVGDYFHYSKMEPTTERSGHVLDASGRAPQMYAVGLSIMRYVIEYAASKHKHVHVINASGNHDGLLAFAMSAALEHIYENNPRIFIDTAPTMRHYARYGKNMFGVTHGDKSTDARLPLIMAQERASDWGETTHRSWFRGHHHHDSKGNTNHKEFNGCYVEQVRTLAPKDSYAAGHGHLAGQSLRQLFYHKDYGPQGSVNCGIDLLRAIIQHNKIGDEFNAKR